MRETVLVTGGAGFIGANFVLEWLAAVGTPLVNLDLLTYAGNALNVPAGDERHELVHGDIADEALVGALLDKHKPRAIVHFAAETHVDRSIVAPDAFVRTNVQGTFALLEQAHRYWSALPAADQARFRFLHVSTDEVYGSLGPNDPPFTEQTAYAPNSPYAASKAASDHFVRAYFHTYGLPVLTVHCSNNYGPLQFPEKLIPLMISHAVERKPLPVYGDGGNVRDWLYVRDACEAVRTVLSRGRPGETYNIGGGSERANIGVVESICDLVDELVPDSSGMPPRRHLITFVKDRPGHDRRYSIRSEKARVELGWHPAESFETGLRKTVQWYLAHPEWVQSVRTGGYQDWLRQNYAKRGQAGQTS